MPIIEKNNNVKLSLPRVTADIKLEPPVKYPLPSKSGFALNIVGPAGSGKTSTMVSLIKSRDIFFKRFHNIMLIMPDSSLASLASNPFDDLAEDKQYDELNYENLERIINQTEENKGNDELSLLIMDDISAELQDPILLKKLMRLFLNRRHLYLSVICISHSLTGKAALPLAIRKNCSHCILFKPSCGLEVLNQEFLHLSHEKFKELIDFVYDKDHNHLLIELYTSKLFKNFNTIIQT